MVRTMQGQRLLLQSFSAVAGKLIVKVRYGVGIFPGQMAGEN